MLIKCKKIAGSECGTGLTRGGPPLPQALEVEGEDKNKTLAFVAEESVSAPNDRFLAHRNTFHKSVLNKLIKTNS